MNIKDNMLKHEKYLSEFATKDQDAIRLFGNLSDDIRPNFFVILTESFIVYLILDTLIKLKYLLKKLTIIYRKELFMFN